MNILNDLLAQPGFSPGLIAIGAVMYFGWAGAYFFIIRAGFRDHTFGVPWAILGFNITWEFFFSFNLLDQRLSPFFLWGNRLWLIFDIIIVGQFLAYGRSVQTAPLLRRYFFTAWILSMILSFFGLVTFVPYFNDLTGSAVAMFMNLVMSVLFIILLMDRPDMRGLSYGAAWLKMISSAFSSLFLYIWLPAQFEHGRLITHKDVLISMPRTWGFMYFLYISIVVVDCIYIWLLTQRRKELGAPGGRERPSLICRSKVVPFLVVALCSLRFNLDDAYSGPADADTSTSTNRIERLQRLDLESILASVASKKEEPVFATPASVTAISDEEIQRSGARSIPAALALAPGIEVAQITGNQWAVSSRGFNDRYANKLLVLEDGRTLYNSAFGGVFWDMVDPMLDSVSQIEIVRGPGGTLWGANAVNGVVNIVTKDARDTLGGYATSGGGPNQAFGEARYGESLGETGALREYVKYDWHQPLSIAGKGSAEAHDGSQTFATGYRGDWQLEASHLTMQGDYIYGWREQPIDYVSYTAPYTDLAYENFTAHSINQLGRLTHDFEDGSNFRLQAYFDHYDQNSDSYPLTYNVGDIDFQHRLLLPLNEELTYGVGYRLTANNVDNRGPVYFQTPPNRTLQLPSAFVRDEISLIPDRLKVILGTKMEHNDFTGFELQPDARVLFLASSNQTLWAGVSRSVRSPPLATDNLTALEPQNIGIVRYTGEKLDSSERLTSVQTGWRVRLGDRAGFDASAYYSFYNHLDSLQYGTPFIESIPGPPHLIIPVSPASAGRVETYGGDLGADYQPFEWWRLRAGYSFFDYTGQSSVAFDSSASPRHQAFLRSSIDLPADLRLDGWLRERSRLKLYTLGAFTELDMRLAWRPNRAWELAIVGQNLFHDRRQDFGIPPGEVAAPISAVPRTFYGQLTAHF